jgi:hypothetical protein
MTSKKQRCRPTSQPCAHPPACHHKEAFIHGLVRFLLTRLNLAGMRMTEGQEAWLVEKAKEYGYKWP